MAEMRGAEISVAPSGRRIFVRTLLSWLRERAERAGLVGGRSGAVVVAQRFGSALNLTYFLVGGSSFTDSAKRSKSALSASAYCTLDRCTSIHTPSREA